MIPYLLLRIVIVGHAGAMVGDDFSAENRVSNHTGQK